MEKYITEDGYIDPNNMIQKKMELKLDDTEMAEVYTELGIRKLNEGKYDAAKSLFLKGIIFYDDSPWLHYALGITLVYNYEKKQDKKELKDAERELKKARHLIKRKKL